MRIDARLDDPEDLLQRADRVAGRAKVLRDEVRLAVRKHRHRRNGAVEMVAVVDFRQRGLHGSVAAVDDEHRRLHAGDHRQRLRHLGDVVHLVVEDVGMIRDEAPDPGKRIAVARRAGV